MKVEDIVAVAHRDPFLWARVRKFARWRHLSVARAVVRILRIAVKALR